MVGQPGQVSKEVHRISTSGSTQLFARQPSGPTTIGRRLSFSAIVTRYTSTPLLGLAPETSQA
jgi:hypothetical protein